MQIKKIRENFLISYDKLFLLGIKAFCGTIKRGRDLIRKKKVKIMNQLFSVKIWEVLAPIHSKICKKRNYVTLYADPVTVLMEYDEQLAINPQHYLEDVIIDFEK